MEHQLNPLCQGTKDEQSDTSIFKQKIKVLLNTCWTLLDNSFIHISDSSDASYMVPLLGNIHNI